MNLRSEIWNQQPDWKSKPFTYKYSQPAEYHYSLDSIELIWKLAAVINTRKDFDQLRVLDLCSGCGVLGFELHYWCRNKISSAAFVEIQPEYEEHFEKNKRLAGCPPEDFTFHRLNFNQLPQEPAFRSSFDLIVCNPPYFRPDSAMLAKSSFRNRCHFLLDGSFSELCEALVSCLRPAGEACILLKDLGAQGIDQFAELMRHCAGRCDAEILGQVRGIPVAGVRRYG